MVKKLITIGLTLILVLGLCGCVDEEIKDTDGDGYNDDIDMFPDNPDEWEDTDGDTYGDNSDAFPTDPTEHVDTDGDGVGDNADEFPDDPTEHVDTDGDGYGDNIDFYPDDPERWEEEVYDWVEMYSYNLGNENPLIIEEDEQNITSNEWMIVYNVLDNETLEFIIEEKQNQSYFDEHDTWWNITDTYELNLTGEITYTLDEFPQEYRFNMKLTGGFAEVKIYEWELI